MSQALNPSTAGSALSVSGAAGFSADSPATRPKSESWALKPGLAAEYLNVVRNVFPGSQQNSNDGHVHHEAVQYTSKTSDTVSSSHANTPHGHPALTDPDETSCEAELGLSNEQVLLEAERVRAKFMYDVNTSTEVILRFNFMTNRDTRVRYYIFESSDVLINRKSSFADRSNFHGADCYVCGICCNLCRIYHPAGPVHQYHDKGS